MLVPGQFSYELPAAGETLAPPRYMEDSNPPGASLQAPSQLPDSIRFGAQPSAYENPLDPVSTELAESAATLLRGVLGGTGERPLEGQTVTLGEVLQGTAAGELRGRATRLYWQLSKLVAEHRFCVEEANFLFGLAIPQAAYQQAVLASAQASAKAEEARSRLDARRAQYALAAITGRVEESRLPLPADLPFTGVYETRFDTLQVRGSADRPLARIHATLPMLRELLQQQAEAVYAAERALHELQQAYQDGQVPLSNVLDSFVQLRGQRRALLSSVLEYNESIAEYALTVASPHLPVDRIVGMLIETSDGQRSVLATRRDHDAVRRVSNDDPIDDSATTRPER
jgi:PIN domain nuclease of toxin-antitoxin system